MTTELAGDRPRATEKNGARHRRARACPSPSTIAKDRPRTPIKNGFPSPLQRSRGTGPRPTVKKRFPATLAGDRPPPYDGKNASAHRRARACPSPCLAQPNHRGGNPPGCAYGIRGPPHYGKIKTRARAYRNTSKYETPSLNQPHSVVPLPKKR